MNNGVITLIVTNSDIKVYQNGIFRESKTVDTLSFIDFTSDLYINREPTGVARDMYSKYVISFKIYNRELTAKEIVANYEYEQWLSSKLESTVPTITENYDVFVIAGQSNAVGYGTPKLSTDIFDPSLVCQYKQNNTIEAVQYYPLDHIEYKSDSIAFQHTFIQKYIEEGNLASDRKILLVPCAAPGTSFVSGRWDENGDLQKSLIRRIQEVKSMNNKVFDIKFKGILWHQGESDVIEGNSPSTYKNQLKNLINNVRNVTEEDTPFIMGEWQENWAASNSSSNSMLVVINEIVNELPNCGLTSASRLSEDSINGVIHFSAEAQRLFGERYYEIYSNIVKD